MLATCIYRIKVHVYLETFLLVKQCFSKNHLVHDSAKSVKEWRRKEVNVFIYARQLNSGVSLIPLLPHDI